MSVAQYADMCVRIEGSATLVRLESGTTFRQLVCIMVPVYIVCVNNATATIPLGC